VKATRMTKLIARVLGLTGCIACLIISSMVVFHGMASIVEHNPLIAWAEVAIASLGVITNIIEVKEWRLITIE